MKFRDFFKIKIGAKNNGFDRTFAELCETLQQLKKSLRESSRDELFLECSALSGANLCKTCRQRKINVASCVTILHKYLNLLAHIGLDAAQN